jgi:hypothetical protein
MSMEQQTTDPTRYRFPGLWSPSHTDHVANLEKALVEQEDRLQAVEKERPNRPEIVCICGSSRFCDLAAVHAWNFEKMGKLALSMHLLPDWYWQATNKVGHDHGAEQEGVAHILDELHLRKIDLCDSVFVVNKGGYIGERTRIEIDYATSKGKRIEYLEPHAVDEKWRQ